LSLSWREIDAVLEEIPFENSLIRDIYQPSHPRIIFELYRPSLRFKVLFVFANPNCRLHLLTRKISKPRKPQRFVSFLRAHARGGRIVSAGQLGQERIVRIEIRKADRTVLLWCRLWASAANMIVTNPEGTILDALYRRPKRGEISGGRYSAEQDSASTGGGISAKKDRYVVRDLPGPGSFNERVERYYFELEERQERNRLESSLLARLRREENRLLASVQGLERKREQYREFETFKKRGDLILSNIHRLQRGDRWLTAEDSDDPSKTWDIELDPRVSPAENAESCYRRYRKSKSGLDSLQEELQQQRQQLDRLRDRIQALESGAAEASLESLRQELRRGTPKRRQTQPDRVPGLLFTSGPFTILVGRNARENDELLRHHVRGNDTWLHARDYPGGYVFIRSIPGKTPPLDTLLDAANLALLYSKTKGSAQGDVFYTQVKYLKRIKEAKTGKVIPTREKNLHVKLDSGRIRRLRQEQSEFDFPG
jgi:predicted ribosome quality control (RQC) complex YloA/Tae2 family protein